MLDEVTAHPLSWPTGWPRTPPARREPSRFYRKTANSARARKPTMSEAVNDLLGELRRLRVDQRDVVISSNVSVRQDGLPRSGQRAPDDPGVAVYFRLKGEPRVLACDRWTDVGSNLRAITKHIEAVRGQERWGVGTLEQAFRGYAALPSGDETKPWWVVLGFRERPNLEEARKRTRDLYHKHHPDKGGDARVFSEVVQAWNQAKKELW